MTEGSGSGSIPLTNGYGSGSRRPKNMWSGGSGSRTLLWTVKIFFAATPKRKGSWIISKYLWLYLCASASALSLLVSAACFWSSCLSSSLALSRVSDPDSDWIRIQIGSGFGLDPDSDWIRIWIGSGFKQVSGSESVFGIRIRIQEGKNDPQK